MLREVVNGYKTKWGFPQVVGAIDGTHILIVRPKDSAADYYHHKGFYSIIVQGQRNVSRCIHRVVW